jgi:hypothetical protein
MYSSGDQIKKNEMGEACGDRRGAYRVRWGYLMDRRGAYRVRWGYLMDRDRLEGLGSSRYRVSAWTGMIWPRIGIGGRPL